MKTRSLDCLFGVFNFWPCTPLPSYVARVGSGAGEKVCGLERTREGATMGNFNFLALGGFLDERQPLKIPS